jgi:hypothetical protein
MPSNVPTMRTLLDDPVYRAYVKRVPPIPDKHNPLPAWQLWIETPEHKWLTKNFLTYADAWRVGVARYKTGCDFTLTSRRMFYAPPGEWYRVRTKRRTPYKNPHTGEVRTHDVVTRWRQTWYWPELDLNWCGRCRRPTYWMPLHDGHHALRRLPAISPDDNYRCLICGIRWIAQPDIAQMVKVEAKP